MMKDETWFTYILQCADNTLYTGYTNNLEKRIETHNNGKGAKYTRSRRPVTLFYKECYKDQRSAMQREYAIKKLSRAEKLALAQKIK